MVKMKQRLLTLGMCLFMALATYIPLSAEDQVVFDQADLMAVDETKTLAQQAKEFEEKSGWEVFIVTKDDYDGRSAMEYADDFFDERTDVSDSGFVLLIDMYIREIYVSTAGDAIPCFNDERIEYILDEGYYYVADGEYADGFEAMLDEAEYYFDKGIPDNQEIYDTETGKSTYYRKLTFGEVLASLAVGVGVALIIFLGVMGKYRLKFGTYKYDYRKYGKLDLKYHDDQFMNQTVTTRRIPRNTSSGGGGGGSRSSSHRSSSGRSHGGGGRRF